MSEMTYLRAISDGLRTEMRSDERVLLMGEDIGVFGGAFKSPTASSTSSAPTA